uniref:ATP-dependent DNA helicase n=1 Tax=Salix viminalis TaxID=40686 RepID=A0A6N2KEN5_SALVM
MPSLILSDDQLQNYVLYELEQLFNASATTLQDHNLSMFDGQLLTEITNKLLREELNYDLIELKSQHSLNFASLNHGQRWHHLVLHLFCFQMVINMCHSRFKIPFAFDESSICAIKKNTHLSNLLQKTSLIVWDELSMINRCSFEALDRSMPDVLLGYDNYDKDLPFDGKTILLGGDFCQILPVIPGGTKDQIINASLTNSTLWSKFIVLTLIEKICLSINGLASKEKAEISEFSKWILSRTSYSDNKNTVVAEINDFMLRITLGEKHVNLSIESICTSSTESDN